MTNHDVQRITTMPRLLLTRTQENSQRVLDALPAQMRSQVEPVISPLLRIVPHPHPKIVERDVIFTSPQAASLMPGNGRTAWCVGQHTAQVAQAQGFVPHCADGDAEALFALILAARPGPLVHLCGHHRRGNLAARLSAQGLPCREIEIYDQQAQPLSDAALDLIHGDQHVVVPLFSPRSSMLFRTYSAGASARLSLVALSPAVADGWPDARISATPRFDDMIAAICQSIDAG